MKTPYVFNLGGSLLPQNALQTLPGWCRQSLSYAKEQYRFRNAAMDFVLQRYGSNAFQVDLIQLKTSAAQVHLPFIFDERRPLLHFMPEGEFLVATVTGGPIVVTGSNTFLLGYAEGGAYMFQAAKGTHVAVVVTLLPQWMERTFGRLGVVRALLDGFYSYDEAYRTMYCCRMDVRVRRRLQHICDFRQPDEGAVEGNLLRHISYMMEYYDRTCAHGNRDLAYRIKAYLHAHYRDKDLSVKQLSVHFSTTERTLLNQFKRQYHTGILQYYTNLRITKALFLMENEGLAAREVYALVGYADESTFRQALARYPGNKN